MAPVAQPALAPRIWQVGALCRAIADSLEARFNPVAVRGEVSGLSRPSSGHLYFSLKDAQGQIRCAMFRRAATLLEFVPREGEMVEVWGRLGVYEARGDLQLIVETMTRAGQGALFEQFLRLKARLEAEGLFDEGRKRVPRALPRGIGLVTSPGAAALHDVVTALRRRARHVPVVLAPAAVQGAGAPAELIRALESLYRLAGEGAIDTILLVRGGGSIEDLWAFNDEQLARAIVRSPVPLVSGVGHETDFTIADFCADVRAPTPTAAAELAARPREDWLADLQAMHERLHRIVQRRVDHAQLRLDQAGSRLGRPLARLSAQQMLLDRCGHRLHHAMHLRLERDGARLQSVQQRIKSALRLRLDLGAQLLDRQRLRMELLDPRLVLRRGYALLSDEAGHPVTSVGQTHPGQQLRAALADGEVDLTVRPPSLL
ncbi:exodeoxyribonuclease VII large subunit [Ramlibacter tataouinensis]|uniref:Exodeoxyribonuclease 7 large subunit n=1 Tax=Ramlibacter tataouinensis TaxID=94132 RepID=A0A127JN63_9BURK|nr:exodeoxyribonuclease VII large subunit [Ramlibacter tataouinensis]AMO21546.1 exodeoxyribonuclease VII [Ramlibacter tataouinensis]